MKTLLLPLILAVFLTAWSVASPCPMGDINKDCQVKWEDLQLFADQWLDPSGCSGPNCADLDGVSGVNMFDYSMLAINWLMEGYPVVINEFLASNGALPGDPNGLVDEDGDASDWIEIYNPSDATINMNGWYLTDDAGNLTKWPFPNMNLVPGEFRIVFASGKDRRNPSGQLHTNFDLDKDGEYLALVAENGLVVVHEYSPQFPQQLRDISYGLQQYITTMVAPGDIASYHVPTITDAGEDWTAVGFNDSAWDTGSTGLGFGIAADPNLKLYLTLDDGAGTTATDSSGNGFNSTLTNMDTATDWVAGHVGTSALDFDGIDDYVAIPALGINTVDVTITAWIKRSGDQADWSGIVFRQEGGTWFGIHVGTDNELRYHWNATNWTWDSGLDTPDGQWAFIAIAVEPTQATIYLGQDGAMTSSVHSGPHSVEDWSGVTTVGRAGFYPGRYFRGVIDDVRIYNRLLSGEEIENVFSQEGTQTNVQAQMRGINASLWARLKFNLDDISFIDTLALRMKYMDGFVAYLNGHEVARRNAPSVLQWNSAATATRSVEEAMVFEEINLMAFLDKLQVGNNVLAIQGLNNDKDDGQFLILPELVAATNELVPQYFTTVTPGKLNSRDASGVVSDVEFSHKRGFYDSGFQLVLTTDTSGAEIHYTLNGSDPRDPAYLTYTAPLNISSTSIVRACAFKAGYLVPTVKTHTYIFVNDVKTQSPNGQTPGPGWPPPGSYGPHNQIIDYGMDPVIITDSNYADLIDDALLAIPSVSLVTDLKNLFDPLSGIYVNAVDTGRLWERPISIELINPDGSVGFQVDAGARIRGAAGRSSYNPKHNFRFHFRSEYGNAKLKFALYGDEGADEFDGIDLRAEQTFSWSSYGSSHGTFMRDVFARDVQGAMDEPYTRGKFCHVYINGQYWGLYVIQERSEASFGASYFGGDKSDYDALKPEWTPGTGVITATDGNNAAWKRLWIYANSGFASNEAYYRVQGMNVDGQRNPSYERLVDIDNVIDYMISIYYTGDNDAPITAYQSNKKCNNYYTVYNRKNPDGFKYFRNDAECSLGMGENDRTGPYPAGSEDNWPDREGWQDFNPQWLHQQLTQNAEYRLHFADRVQKFYFNNGVQTPAGATNLFKSRSNSISTAIIGESARWGDAKAAEPFTRNKHWRPEIDSILNYFIPTRTAISRNQFIAKGWYPNVEAPTFNKHGGEVSPPFSLTMTAPAGAIYYTLNGSDPRQRLTGNPVGTQYTGPVILNKSTLVKARVRSGTTWSALTEATFAIGPVVQNLRITEIMYYPAGDPNAEFIELKNIGSNMLSLNLVKFTEGIDFTFPAADLLPGEYAIVLKDFTAFYSMEPNVPPTVPILGPYTGSLDNAGERIRLKDAIGRTILDFKYKDVWYPITNGDGFSLTIINAADSNTNHWAEKDYWRASAGVGGSPGWDDTGFVPSPGAVVINEVLAHSHAGAPDWIELHNTTGSAINIGGWFLSDSDIDDANLMKYEIGTNTMIPAGGYAVFYEDQDFANPADPGCHKPFALSENGDKVCLSSGQGGVLTGYREKEELGASETAVAFGRYFKASSGTFNFVAMSLNTPGGANAYPKVGPIVINEIMYNPESGNQAEEFVELYNITGAAVNLFDAEGNCWKFTDGIDFNFPPGTTIPAHGYLLVAKDPTTFNATYTVPPGVDVLGPFENSTSLSNSGEQLQIAMPGDVDEFGIRHYIRVDRVNYSDGSHPENFPDGVDPWPTSPDGGGASLSRLNPEKYGNDPNNWIAADPPTPGE